MRTQTKIVEILLLIACSVFNATVVSGQKSGNDEGYKIEVSLENFKNDTIILGQRFNESYIRKDTTILDGSGEGVFKGQEALPQGMYLVFLPNQRFFDLLIGADQHFSFENDTADLLTNMEVSGSVENEAFYTYQVFLKDKREEAMALQEKIKSAGNEHDSIHYSDQLNELNEDVQGKIYEVIEQNDGNFLSVFLLALQEIIVPDPPKDENGNITDSQFQYRYYKEHYLDNFDISDVRLLRTPVYQNKIMHYINKVVVQVPDSLIVAVDMLIEASRSDEQLFRFMLITLFNHFAQSPIMGMDAVYVHIAEKYYVPEADWSDEDFLSKLQERVDKLKPTLIGQIARDFQLVRVTSDHFLVAMEDEELKKNPYVGDFFQLHDVLAP